MKKLLCVLMSVVMIVSSAAVIGASAAEGYAAKNPVTDSFSSYDEFVAENADKAIYGYTYDFLYEDTSFVDWTKLDIKYNKAGMPWQSTPGSIALAFGNMGAYAKRIANDYFLNGKLYTEEYAVALINFIGKLVYPDFVEVETAFDGMDTNPNEDDFFKIVAEKTGIHNIIQSNWCDVGVDFKPFLTAMGVDLTDIVNSDFARGKAIAKALIQGAVNTCLAYGPLQYIFMLLDTFSSSYSSTLYDATTSLFSLKINRGKPVKHNGEVIREVYGVDELKSMEALLTYVFDGVLDYRFFRFPDRRMALSDSDAEKLLFLMMYFAINYNYCDNAEIVDGLYVKLAQFFADEKRPGYNYENMVNVLDRLPKMIDTILKGNISLDAVDLFNNLTQEIIENTPDDILTQVRNWFSKLFRKIADYFDYLFKLFTGEIKYGESLLDR